MQMVALSNRCFRPFAYLFVMNMKKVLPIVLLIIMAVATLAIRTCRTPNQVRVPDDKIATRSSTNSRDGQQGNQSIKLDRNATDLFFTKHARCRMKCRQITQQEVKDILANGTINYNKSDLQDPRGATYAVEGNTNDRQHVRIIFAPKESHLTVVTVIDLDVEHECSCD